MMNNPTSPLVRATRFLIALALMSAVPRSAIAQAGECRFDGFCLSGDQFPTGTHSTSSTEFVTVATNIFAGEWARYSVASGQTYEWSICTADGGSAGYDATLTLRTDAVPGSLLCFSDDRCGFAPKIRWTSTITGTVRVQVNAYISEDSLCGSNELFTTLRWRCAVCGPPSVTPIIADIPDAMIQAPNAYSGPTPSLTQGTLPMTWSLIASPAGMTISASTGVVSWPTSTTTGSPHTITLRATNTAGFDNESWVLTVTAPPPPPCEGDATGDGVINFADITAALTFWAFTYPAPGGEGDANADLTVNFADITSVLTNWGLPCD